MSPRPGDDELDECTRRFNRLMGAMDTPMVIVTTVGADGERAGCLVGFSTQCGMNPSRYLVCLSNKNHTFAVAERAEHLGVHLVPRTRHDLAELFGAETGDDVDKFGRCAWREGPEGVPLVDGCPDWFVGRIIDRHDYGDHVGMTLAVVAASGHAPGGELLRLSDVEDLEPGHFA
jgi:flavin reductase (DIM6/NTAB) family NADH-FMN oxidoreductase RutF